MRTFSIALLLTTSILSTLSAQSMFEGGVIETQGTVLYSYSKQSNAYYWTDVPFDMYLRSYQLSLQPSAGYFLNDRWEVVFQPQFLFQSTTQNFPRVQNGVMKENVDTYRIYRLGIAAGVLYHTPLSSRIISFIGTSVGVSWDKMSFENTSYRSTDRAWGRPDIAFPNFSTGLKIFVANNWALVPQVQLTSKTYTKDYHSFENELNVSFGMGFAVLWGRE